MADYIAAFFEEIEKRDKRLAGSLYQLGFEGNFMAFLGYKLSNDKNGLEKIIQTCAEMAKKDKSTSSDMYCEAGIFAIIKGESETGKNYIYTAINYLSIESTALLLEPTEDEESLEVLKELNINREADYNYLLKKADSLNEILDCAYAKFCKTYNPRIVIQDMNLKRELRYQPINSQLKNHPKIKPKKILN